MLKAQMQVLIETYWFCTSITTSIQN